MNGGQPFFREAEALNGLVADEIRNDDDALCFFDLLPEVFLKILNFVSGMPLGKQGERKIRNRNYNMPGRYIYGNEIRFEVEIKLAGGKIIGKIP